MKKLTIKIVISFVLISIIVVVAYIFFNVSEKPSIDVIQNKPIDVSTVAQTEANKTIASGNFTDSDVVHKGSGTVKIVETADGPVLYFENFKTINGPDLFVYLSPNEAGQDLGEFASLGKLQKVEGDQAYSLPANYKDYKSVVVWCRAFNTTFTTASLAQR